MTQIVTMSPVTAAYASQGMKTNIKSSTSSLFEQRIHTWTEDARVNANGRMLALLSVIQPPALVLALITSTAHQPQVTLGEVQQRYEEITG